MNRFRSVAELREHFAFARAVERPKIILPGGAAVDQVECHEQRS